MTEKEAREAGSRLKIGRFEPSNNGKATEIGESTGVVKVVIDGDRDRLLGAAVLAHDGGELVHILVDLMNADAPCSVVHEMDPSPSRSTNNGVDQRDHPS